MTLTEAAAERYVAASSFVTGPTGFVGTVVELLPVASPAARPPRGPAYRRLRHGYLTGSYDGVLAVSSPPSPGVDVAVRRAAQDLALARDLLAADGVASVEGALDAAGLRGYAGTAAVRVCVDAGVDEADAARRWAVAHAVGPVLAAAFANSPLRAGQPAGWRSARQGLRLAIDAPSGGGPTPGTVLPGGLLPGGAAGDGRGSGGHEGFRAAWAAYVLDAPTPSGGTFRELLRGPHTVGPAELRRHLDALPAPVRARGHLELGMIDAQSGDGWQVAAAVAAVLVDDPRAAAAALEATADLPADAWTRAARAGLTDPLMAAAARHCFAVAYGALARQGTSRELRDAVADYVDTRVCRSRAPADERLAAPTDVPVARDGPAG